MACLSTPAIRLSTGELVLAEELTNFLGILRRTHRAVAKVAKLLGRLTFEEVAPSSFPTFHFALAGDFEAFSCATMSFLLRHLKSSLEERLKASCEIHILEQLLCHRESPSKGIPRRSGSGRFYRRVCSMEGIFWLNQALPIVESTTDNRTPLNARGRFNHRYLGARIILILLRASLDGSFSTLEHSSSSPAKRLRTSMPRSR